MRLLGEKPEGSDKIRPRCSSVVLWKRLRRVEKFIALNSCLKNCVERSGSKSSLAWFFAKKSSQFLDFGPKTGMTLRNSASPRPPVWFPGKFLEWLRRRRPRRPATVRVIPSPLPVKDRPLRPLKLSLGFILLLALFALRSLQKPFYPCSVSLFPLFLRSFIA